MKLSELLNNVSIVSTTADYDMEISSVCIDSRKAVKNSLFVAITGFETDGHLYIDSAVEKGACCIICEKIPETKIPYVLVDSSRKELAKVAANYTGHPEKKMKFIGVTGTNGKTTSTYLLKHILEDIKRVKVGLIGTNQNMIGDEIVPTERTTPEALELFELFKKMADAGCDYVVMEVSSHALYLNRVYGVQYEVGIFTNLTEDHLDFHKTMEKYCKAKEILFSQSDTGVINLDDPYARKVIADAKCPMFTYSVKNMEADLVAKNVVLKPDKVCFQALTMEELVRTELGIPGEFSVYNALGVIAAGLNLGMSLEEISASLKTAKGVKGRAEVVQGDGDYTILIDYAHTPDALENILKTVKGFANGRVVVLFGCGGDRDPKKRPIMGEIAVRLADRVIITSDNPRTEKPETIIDDILAGIDKSYSNYEVEPDRRKAIFLAINTSMPGDVIVLAGKGHETYQIIGKEKHHMDEREIIADCLSERKKA